MLTVGALGSCRVHKPLTIAAGAGRLKYVKPGFVGYIHNTKEILQVLKILRREVSPPSELMALLSLTTMRYLTTSLDLFDRFFGKADVILIEVASSRIIEHGGYYLQIHRLRELLGDQFVRELFDDGKRTEASPRAVPVVTNKQSIKLATGLAAHEQSDEEVSKDLLLISSIVKRPLVVVTHFVNAHNGNPIPQRATIVRGAHLSASRDPTIQVFDPTPMVDEAGHEVSLKDLGHYKDEFEPIVAAALADVVDQAATRMAGPAPSAKPAARLERSGARPASSGAAQDIIP